MDRTELVNNIETGRSRLESALTRLMPEQMTSPDMPGEWSVKDLLAHLGWWQRRVVMIYQALKDGVRPETVLLNGTIDELNTRVLADYRARDLEEVRAFERQAYLDLLAIAETAPEDELFGHHTFSWTGGQPFVDWVAGDTYEHYAEHLPALETLLAEQEARLRPSSLEAGESQPEVIEPEKPQENPIIASARAFLEKEGRYIDQTRLDFHFGSLSLDDLIEALGRYMNEDGGFHGLEVDIQAPQSNPFADELALVALRWADALTSATRIVEAQPAPQTLLAADDSSTDPVSEGIAVEALREAPLQDEETEVAAENLPASENQPAAEDQPEAEDLAEEEPTQAENAGELAASDLTVLETPAAGENPGSGEPAEVEPEAEVELPTGGAVNPLVDTSVRAKPLFQRLVAHLEAAQQDDGTWRFAPEIYQSPLAPWFQGWQWPNLSPSCSIAGLLKQLGAGSDTLHARVQALFEQLATPKDLSGGDFYAARPYAYYFQTEWEQPQAEFYRQGVVWWLVRKLASDPDFDATHFFEFAPTPDSAISKRLPPALIAEQLDRLMAEQQPDGGWPTPYDARWRPWNTVNNLLVLRAYGRI